MRILWYSVKPIINHFPERIANKLISNATWKKWKPTNTILNENMRFFLPLNCNHGWKSLIFAQTQLRPISIKIKKIKIKAIIVSKFETSTLIPKWNSYIKSQEGNHPYLYKSLWDFPYTEIWLTRIAILMLSPGFAFAPGFLASTLPLPIYQL